MIFLSFDFAIADKAREGQKGSKAQKASEGFKGQKAGEGEKAF